MNHRPLMLLAALGLLSACPGTPRSVQIDPRSGYESQTVTLTGDFVTSAEKVEFGGNVFDHNPLTVGPQAITAVVPGGAQTGVVTVHLKPIPSAPGSGLRPDMLDTSTPFQVLGGTADDVTYARPVRGLLSSAQAVPAGLELTGDVSIGLTDWWKLEVPGSGAWAHTYEFEVMNEGVSDDVTVKLHGTPNLALESVTVPASRALGMWITVRWNSALPLVLEVSSAGSEIPYRVRVTRTPLYDDFEPNNQPAQILADPSRFLLEEDEIVEAHLAPAVDLATGGQVDFMDHYWIPTIGPGAHLRVAFTGLYEAYPSGARVHLEVSDPNVLGGTSWEATSPADQTLTFIDQIVANGATDQLLSVTLSNPKGGKVAAPVAHGAQVATPGLQTPLLRAPGYALHPCFLRVDAIQ